MSKRARAVGIWSALFIAIAIPVAAAALSPLLAWRGPIYIVAGFAGIIGLPLLLVQPLLATGRLPKLRAARGRALHRMTGGILVVLVVAHVVGLWITSPPDVIDALLFRSPTPFSYLGVIAMWGVFATALLAAYRKRLRLSLRVWRLSHSSLAGVIVIATLLHALLIEGAMEPVTKAALCSLILAATILALTDPRRRINRS